ncbi:maf-like protein [Cucumis melo var. makuwa]|uniref:Maf-like protein n=1 Tax=Cucumis melo var. makuwa TaxID=1194695 RepID=A0A5A7TDU8_CUCMM|nr:maf-like protein [Cucumis melo var. makuwa]TYK19653.1 maf-like protein [Cucumis melo var. makuwa]
MDATSSSFKIILGSSSVARRKILSEMGYEFTIMSADIDEKAIRKEKPEELVVALAEAKADAIISNLQNIDTHEKEAEQTVLIAADTADAILGRLSTDDFMKDAEPTLLITSDQVVIYEGVIREKPASKEEARQFLKDYSGGHAATLGSVLVTNLKTGFRKGEWDRVEIFFNEIPDEVIDKLVEEGTVLYVAGGLIIEHPLILPYVKEVIHSQWSEFHEYDVCMACVYVIARELIQHKYTHVDIMKLKLHHTDDDNSDFGSLQVGTTDSVMGLPKALTEKLLKEAM